MPICSFSGKEIPRGTGIMYIKKDGKILWFLNSKCEKGYLKLGRKPRNTPWTAEAIAAKKAAHAAGQKPAGSEPATTKGRKGAV
jgi:large subunit ribosomal protein L24e